MNNTHTQITKYIHNFMSHIAISLQNQCFITSDSKDLMTTYECGYNIFI